MSLNMKQEIRFNCLQFVHSMFKYNAPIKLTTITAPDQPPKNRKECLQDMLDEADIIYSWICK